MPLKELFKGKRDEAPFLIFIAFLVSFTIARLYEIFRVSGPSLNFGRYTLHHLYYGIALLIIAGWIAINYKHKNLFHITALLYGAGLGIFFDEIGLILTHFGNYWDGITYTVVMTASLVLLNIIFFSDFWNSVGGNILSYVREKRLKYGPLNLMGLLDILNEAEEKMPKTRKLTSAFTGVVLVVAGIMILEFPDLIRYWVAAAFFLSGFAYFMRTIK